MSDAGLDAPRADSSADGAQDAAPDAPGIDALDAASDAGPDAFAGPVDVTVLSLNLDGAVDTTAMVIFEDAAGAVLFDGTVDSSGRAMANVPAGASAIVIQSRSTTASSQTDTVTQIRGIAPGDHLIVGQGFTPRRGVTSSDHMTVQFTTPAGATASGQYLFLSPCSSDTPSATATQATLYFFNPCRTASFDVLALATGFGTPPYQYIWQPSNSHVSGGTITLPATWQTASMSTVTVTNAPHANVQVSISTSVGGNRGTLGTRTASANSGMATLSVPYVPTVGDSTTLSVQSFENFVGTGLQEYTRVTAGAAGATLSCDMAALPALPDIGVVTATSTGGSWTQVQSGTPDARLFEWQETFVDQVGRTHAAQWDVIDAGQGAAIVLPALPASHAALDPRNAASVTVAPGAAVRLVDFDVLTGYDAARAYPNALTGQDVLTQDHLIHASRNR
jgi:hypothetical protein